MPKCGRIEVRIEVNWQVNARQDKCVGWMWRPTGIVAHDVGMTIALSTGECSQDVNHYIIMICMIIQR